MKSFKDYADIAMRDTRLSGLRPVVEKELLHYDILYAMSKAGLLSDLVFQGGTCLRLCHGAQRYSEDLDFSGGPQFSPEKVEDIVQVLEGSIGSRYGLPVSVHPPKSKSGDKEDPVHVSTWSIRVETRAARKDLPLQRIKIDIDTSLSHTRQVIQPNLNYEVLPEGYGNMLLPAQELREIMANKLVALPVSIASRNRPRYRDIWDLRWLSRKNITPDPVMIQEKAAEHGVEDIVSDIEGAILELPEIMASREFSGEMSRFLPLHVRRDTLSNPDWIKALEMSSLDLLRQVLRDIDSPDKERGDAFEY